MIIDNAALLSGSYAGGVLTPQSIVGAIGNILSQNVYDTFGGDTLNTGGQAVDLGDGQPLPIDVEVMTAVVGAGASVEFQVITADDSALTVNVTPIMSSGAIGVANLGQGSVIPLHIVDAGPRAIRRYVGLRYVISGAATTAGAVVASIVTNHVNLPLPAYKSGFAIQ